MDRYLSMLLGAAGVVLIMAWASARVRRQPDPMADGEYLGAGCLVLLGVAFVVLALAWWIIDIMVRG